MDISAHVSFPFGQDTISRLTDLPQNTLGSNSRWTLWISKETREEFDKRKVALADSKTHSAFVDLLLCYRNQLSDQGNLPPFLPPLVAPKKTKPNASSPKNEKSKVLSDDSAYPPLSGIPQTFHYPQLFNVASTVTLNDSMMMEQQAMYPPPEFAGNPMDPSALGFGHPFPLSQFDSTYHKQFIDSAPYHHEQHPGYYAAETMQNMDEYLNQMTGGHSDYSYQPPSESMNLQSYMTLNTESAAMMTDEYPDLGPFYKPISYNYGGDVIEAFSYIQNI